MTGLGERRDPLVSEETPGKNGFSMRRGVRGLGVLLGLLLVSAGVLAAKALILVGRSTALLSRSGRPPYNEGLGTQISALQRSARVRLLRCDVAGPVAG